MKHGKVIMPGTTGRPARPAAAVPPVTPVPRGAGVMSGSEPPVRGTGNGAGEGSPWRLPSGVELTAFAMQGALVAPGLMRRPPVAGLSFTGSMRAGARKNAQARAGKELA